MFDVIIWNSYDELMNGDQYTGGMHLDRLQEHDVVALLSILQRSHLTAVIVPRVMERDDG